MWVIELLSVWGFAALGAALILVAALLSLFAPGKRRRIRRASLLYMGFVALAGTERILAHLPARSLEAWAEHVHVVGGLLAAFACVDLAAIVIFDLLIPALGISMVAITSDIAVGLGYGFAAFGVLRASGVAASSVVTTSAVVSGVLALSLQTTLGNVIGGIALQLDGSIHVGDWLQLADGQQGRVIAIRWRHTVIETRNWDTLIVPNANLLAQNIVILGKRTDEPVQHRMWVYFNVDFRFAPSHVIDIVRDALAAAPIEGVADDPKPSVICYDFAKDGRDSFAYYAVRYWLTDLASDDPTSSRIRTRVYAALKRADIPLARPSQTLFVTPEEHDSVRAERHRDRRLQAIKDVQLFESLTADERVFVADHLKYAPFTAGETVTRQGAVAHWLYILCVGKVEVRRHAEGAALDRVVATIDAPGFFGEMGLLTGASRRADVIAVTDVECYRLDREGFERILRERPEIAEQLSRTLAQRDIEYEATIEGLDEDAKRARLQHAESNLLGKIQEFFGLERTTKI